ncbi:MAG: sulfurtransferase TusA family protein [Armatimonadota bacterium]|nr:sulfurtransferase TusA family protein [Armatimonadota bacterium]
MSKTTYSIPDTVIEDTRAYRHEVERYLAGDLSPIAFRAIRVPMGIYEQRQNDTYMVRVRGAGGVFLPYQAKRVAELSQEFGSGIVHVTTRQDLQMHDALIQDTPAILESLLEVGLSSRGGGGNTVRNVSACPLSGVCADEVFDVTPYALALTEYLIRDRSSFNLPRKFKVAFSGCARDCALGSVADLGFFAHEKDGVRGFSVYAGGGMGAHSSLATPIEEFVPAESIFEVAEATKRLFDKRGDRTNKHRARLRYVLQDAGPDEFRRLYREELEQVKQEGLKAPAIRLEDEENLARRGSPDPAVKMTEGLLTSEHPARRGSPDPADDVTEGLLTWPSDDYQTWKDGNVTQQKQECLFSVRIPLPLGIIDASALQIVADLAETAGDGVLRTAQDQDMYLTGAPGSNLRPLYDKLKEIGDTDPSVAERQRRCRTTCKEIGNSLVAAPAIRTVACAGSSTCKLGLCLSRGLAETLESNLQDIEWPFGDPIRISGCPNSCGQHPIAPIGLFGSAKRVNGRLVPYYVIVSGGRVAEGAARLAEPAATVPGRAVPDLLKDFLAAAAHERSDGETLPELMDRWGAQYLRRLGHEYDRMPAYDEAPDFYRDFGSAEDFSLAGRGPGECGAGVLDVIALDIESAGAALENSDFYAALVATARALLVTRGLEPKKDREVFAAFSEHLIAPGWVDRRARDLLDAALDFRLGERETLDDLEPEIRALLRRVRELFKSLDSNLSFRLDPIAPAPTPLSLQAPSPEGIATELDLRGVACPMNFVRAKIQLEQIETNAVLDILLDDGEPVRNVPASFAEQGEEVLSVNPEGPHFRVKVKKRS